MLQNIEIDDDIFLYIMQEEFELLITDAIKSLEVEYFSKFLYNEILEFISILQKNIRTISRTESKLMRTDTKSQKAGEDKAKKLSEIQDIIEKLSNMENSLMHITKEGFSFIF